MSHFGTVEVGKGLDQTVQQDLPLEVLLRQKRVASGYNLSAAAARAGVSRRSLTRWETGGARPHLEELQRVLSALGVSAQEREVLLNKLGTPAAIKALHHQDEDAFPFPLPHQGDLLRALRLRLGLRQDDVATKLGVSQATLARWESGRVWPTESMLHQICFQLQAQEEELLALSKGPCSLAERGAAPVELEVLELRLNAIERKLHEPSYYGLGDLLYLSLEAQVLPQLERSQQARFLLVKTLLSHAKYLSERCQPIEAGRTAVQALNLMPRQGDAWNNLRLQGEMYYAVWKYPLRDHVMHLRHWLHRPLDTRHQVWVSGQIAASLLEMASYEEALALEKQSYSLILQQGDPERVANFRNGYAETLLRVGQAAEAAELIQVTDVMGPATRLRTKLTLAEAHLVNKNRPRAQDWLNEAVLDNARLGIAYYQPRILSLTQQL